MKSTEPPLSSTAGDLVSELEMLRIKYKTHALVLVEGRTDLAFIEEYRHSSCQVLDTGSKEKSLQVIDIVEDKGRLQGVAAIVDLDCWTVTGSEWLENENILYDDTSDMETMALNSRALEKYLRNAMTGKDTSQVAQFAQQWREEATRLGIELGYFRTVDCFHPELNLLLSSLHESVADFIDSESLSASRETIASRLTEGSTATSSQQLLEAVHHVSRNYPDGAYGQGKDILCIAVHVFTQVFRQYFDDEDLLRNLTSEIAPRPNSRCYTRLYERLRASFEASYLAMTALYRRIRHWERDNNPFRIIMNYPLERTPA